MAQRPWEPTVKTCRRRRALFKRYTPSRKSGSHLAFDTKRAEPLKPSELTLVRMWVLGQEIFSPNLRQDSGF